MAQSINMLAVCAADDQKAREQLIAENEQTILRTASRMCRRYITRSDDEWSVSLWAFSHAIDVYSEERGDFLPFAQMLIKRNLTDFFRAEKSGQREISVSPHVFSMEAGEDADQEVGDQGVRAAVAEQCAASVEDGLVLEIQAANDMLQTYGFRFFDLAGNSPKQERSKKDCADAVCAMLRSPELCKKLRKKKKLPVKELCRISGLSGKTVDRYRKYIIMAVLILSDDYPRLSEYLLYIKERMKDGGSR